MAVVFRSDVAGKKRYSDYREDLRKDFLYSCAYCSMMEYESNAIRFEIEHYLPQKHHPELKNEYDNLMWSCEKCNSFKGDYAPDELARKRDNVIIKIDEEDPRQHIELSGLRLESKTHKGEFNIEILDLNRQHLRRLREIRERFWKSREYIEQGIRILSTKIALDRLDKKDRFGVTKMKKQLIHRGESFDDELACILKKFACSPLIDEDPEKKQRMRTRKKYLKDQKAILF